MATDTRSCFERFMAGEELWDIAASRKWELEEVAHAVRAEIGAIGGLLHDAVNALAARESALARADLRNARQ